MTTAQQAADRIAMALGAGPTPGPWSQAHRPDHEGMHATQVFGVDQKTIATFDWLPRPTVNGVTETYRGANAEYVAACSPDALRALLAERDELRKDAERYRWLRAECEKHGGLTIATEGSWGLNPWSGDDPDGRIDAARAALTKDRT